MTTSTSLCASRKKRAPTHNCGLRPRCRLIALRALWNALRLRIQRAFRTTGDVQSGMHKISRERVTQLARDLLEAMTRTRAVTLLKEREVVRQSIAHALADELKREEEREENVRRRIATMKKPPGLRSREYEMLFVQLMEEEYLREGLDT